MQDVELQPPTSQAQFVSAMYMAHIEGPKMDWTVNDDLYHRFLKCKKVISWSGDFSMDQYISWCLPAAEVNLDTIWSKYEEFCKPQANEV